MLISLDTDRVFQTVNCVIIINNILGGHRVTVAGSNDFLLQDVMLNDILIFDADALEWRRIGTMKISRWYPAMSLINFNEIKDYCVFS